jgi:hypothetical protein
VASTRDTINTSILVVIKLHGVTNAVYRHTMKVLALAIENLTFEELDVASPCI